jgi:hypothetical protein
MKQSNSKSWSCAMVVCCATLLFYFSAQASGQEDGTSLMLEMTPPEGGYLNIASGVHTFDRYAEIALKATPKAGYQFVCWIGSVAETSNGSTSVFLDSPKMIIAVFERSKFETMGSEGDEIVGGLGDHAQLVRGGGEPDTSLEQAVSEQQPPEIRRPHIPHNVPVPDENKPVPEPATITLLFTGLLMLASRRNKGVNIMDKT